METKSIARKQISRILSFEKETVVNKYYEFEFDKSVYQDILEVFDDYEMASANGVYCGLDDDISIINVDKCCEYLADRISIATEENEVCDSEKRIYEYLKKWKGYEITY